MCLSVAYTSRARIAAAAAIVPIHEHDTGEDEEKTDPQYGQRPVMEDTIAEDPPREREGKRLLSLTLVEETPVDPATELWEKVGKREGEEEGDGEGGEPMGEEDEPGEDDVDTEAEAEAEAEAEVEVVGDGVNALVLDGFDNPMPDIDPIPIPPVIVEDEEEEDEDEADAEAAA